MDKGESNVVYLSDKHISAVIYSMKLELKDAKRNTTYYDAITTMLSLAEAQSQNPPPSH